MSPFWLAVKDWLESVSYICVVAGILFAGFQYLSSIKVAKQNNSISYIQNFQNAEIVGARLKLQRDWIKYPLDKITDRPGSSEVIDELAMSFVFPRGKPVRSDELIRVVDYLDVLGTCVEANVCDSDVVKKHFGNYVHNLNCLYQAPLNRLRRSHNLTNLGLSMHNLIGSSYKC